MFTVIIACQQCQRNATCQTDFGLSILWPLFALRAVSQCHRLVQTDTDSRAVSVTSREEDLAPSSDQKTNSNQIFFQNGQTALSIAEKLGYISLVETLKVVTDTVVTTTTTTTVEEKYKLLAPESMQETFMSDSEDEGGKWRPNVS